MDGFKTTILMIIIALCLIEVESIKDKFKEEILMNVNHSMTVRTDWDEMDSIYTRMTDCFKASQTAYTWIGSMYMDYVIINEMLQKTFYLDHKKNKMKTFFVKLAFFLTKALKLKSGKTDNRPTCIEDIVKYGVKKSSPDTRGKYGDVDYAKCYTGIIDDIHGGAGSYEPASRKEILTIVNMLLYQIDFDIDSIRRSQVVGKLTLSLISSGISAASSFIFPKIGDLSIGGAGIANGGTSLINAIWDDIVDDEKFLYSLQTALLMILQRIAQTPGSKPSIISKHKFGYTTLNEEIHFKMLKLSMIVSTGASKFNEELILFGGESIKESKDIPSQIDKIFQDSLGNDDKRYLCTNGIIKKNTKYKSVEATDNNLIQIATPDTVDIPKNLIYFENVPYMTLINNHYGGLAIKPATGVRALSADADFTNAIDGIVSSLKSQIVVKDLKACKTLTHETVIVEKPICFTKASYEYTTAGLLSFTRSCTNEVSGVFNKVFGNTRVKYKLASSLIPKYDFMEPVLHVDYMDSPLLDAFD